MRTGQPFVILSCLLLAAAGCESTPASGGSGKSGPAWISLERTTGGQSVSPVYRVTLYEDGGVLFEGVTSVKSKGTFTKTIPREKAAAIFTRIEQVELWERQRRYDTETITRGAETTIGRQAPLEVPWDILRAQNRGRTIRIDGLFFAPYELIELKKLIEESVGLAEWIGEQHEWKS